MEEIKQELHKLIDNLDWDKFYDHRTLFTNELMSELKLKLKLNQKEKTIEQKLEDLGFRFQDSQISGIQTDIKTLIYNYADYYFHSRDKIHLEYISDTTLDYGTSSYCANFNRNDISNILNFAQYLKGIHDEENV